MPKKKLTRKQLGAIASMGGITREELEAFLSDAFRRARGADKSKLALELLPYYMPRLKAVDVTQRSDVRVTVTIGGADAGFATPDW